MWLVTHFIRRKFLEYYEKPKLLVPTSLKEREFGFLLHGKQGMIRHRKFWSITELEIALRTIVPLNAFYSSAYYKRPDVEMDKKEWFGADLVFDIDADHIQTSCGKVHDSWSCTDCGFSGRGTCPETCPSCTGGRFKSKTWVCEECLDTAKIETLKLVNFLQNDFGFSVDDLKLYFSGHRGYHVHIENERVHELDSLARKEIVDYVTGLGMNPETRGIIDSSRYRITKTADDPQQRLVGWRKRVIDGIYKLLEGDLTELESIGLSRKAMSYLTKNKENLRKEKQIPTRGVGKKNWLKIIQWVIAQESAKIDTVVTTDIHRLIRLGGSLHGKTGFRKTAVTVAELDKFDPFKEAIAFKAGHADVHIHKAPKFRIGDTYYGPYTKEVEAELPTAAALFLVCRGAARIME
jgi:DNA primase small subunit